MLGDLAFLNKWKPEETSEKGHVTWMENIISEILHSVSLLPDRQVDGRVFMELIIHH